MKFPQAAGAVQEPGWATGLALVIPITLAVMAVLVLAPILPKLLDEFRYIPNADYWVPILLTVTALCVAVFSWTAGWLGDRLGKRRILIGAMIAYGVLGTAPVFLGSFWAIFATRVGVGICEAFIMVLTTTMIADAFAGTARDKWLAAQTAVASVSALVLFTLGGLLGEYGWRAPFLIYLSSFVMVLGILAFTRETKPFVPPRTEADAPLAKFPWWITTGICAVTVVASIMFYVIPIQASIALTGFGVADPARIGLLTAVTSLGVPLGTVVFRFSSRVSTPLLLAMEFALLGAGLVGMGSATGAVGFVIAGIANQIGAGMVLPTLLTWAIRQFPQHARGRGTGIWQGAFQVGQFLSAVVVTFLAARFGGLSGAFAILGYLCIGAGIAAITVWGMTHRIRHTA